MNFTPIKVKIEVAQAIEIELDANDRVVGILDGKYGQEAIKDLVGELRIAHQNKLKRVEVKLIGYEKVTGDE